tara:strand:- start:1125 stop:3443 length:2319 start_codon:yes stop_codon:yes gene_type:complete
MLSIVTLLASATLGIANDYSITANSLGIGNVWSDDAVTPIHVSVTSNVSTPTVAWVQWEVPDGDGDTVFWGKPITLSPNNTTSTWLYAPVQPWANSSIVWDIRLREWNGQEPTTELARTRFSPNSIRASKSDVIEGIIAVFGTRRLGLDGYQPQKPFDVKQEATLIVSGLQSSDLPDAWPCFEYLDAIVWADALPQLTSRQEVALQQWIERGGHLILSLPTIGDPWNIGSNNGPLSELLGGISVTVEPMAVDDLNQVLGRNNGWPNMDITIRTFTPKNNDWDTSDYYPLLTLWNKKVVAVQRNFGFGAVTIIGIDLASGQLASLGLPETDIFWNRILGRCNDTPSVSTISMLKEDEQLSKTIPEVTQLPIGNLIAQEIAMSSTASGRLGTVYILIVSYWLLSGPVVFFLLRFKRKQRWAWVTFSGIACVFTFLTWGLASTTAEVSTPLKHVTIIDHVYGGNGQRAIGWCSIHLPTFGISSVQLAGNNNLLLPWTSPDTSLTPQFVDHREIVVNLDHVPNQFNQPARSTTSNFSYEWVGDIDHSFYDSLIRVVPNDEPVMLNPNGEDTTGVLSGSLINNARQPLENVSIVWVTDRRNSIPPPGFFQNNTLATWTQRNKSGQPLNQMFSWRIPSWKSSETLDLSELEITRLANFRIANKRYEPDNSKSYYRINTVLSKGEWRKKMEMLSLYSHLPPPTYQKNPASKQSPPYQQVTRTSGHNIDFAQWFGRPCIIVMGFMSNAPIPVEISVDGEQISKSTGETFVRWVYPLRDSQ